MRVVLVQPQLRHVPDQSNLAPIEKLVRDSAIAFAEDDVLLLPERFHFGKARESYARDVVGLARALGCHVVGGSHHEEHDGRLVNSGIVVAPDGTTLARYEKLRPYANERSWVEPGSALGEVTIASRNVLVLICADFWFSDLILGAARLPDIVLVPALSVTRKPTPDYSRALWRHLCIARAYEFGAYVGVSDWAHPSELWPHATPKGEPPVDVGAPGLVPRFASGVGGLADPTTIDPACMFLPIGEAGIAQFPIDFAALEAFRRDRVDRGFFWKGGT